MKPKHADDDDDDRPYSLAPEEPVGVSSAAACTTKLNDEKRKALKAYLKTLGPAMRTKYGRHEHYTPAQVRETALERALSIDYLCWAFVLYCAAPEFERIHAAAGEVCDYGAMRETVGAAFFGGTADFSTLAFTDALMSGAGAAVELGADAAGWLTGTDWTGLLDWS